MNQIFLPEDILDYLETEAYEQNTTVSKIVQSIIYREIDRVNSLLDEV